MSGETKPPVVIQAVRLLFLTLAAGFLLAATFIAMGASVNLPLPLSVFLLPLLFVQYGLPALLVQGISTRKNWARIVLAIWVAVCLPYNVLTTMADANHHPVLVSITAILSLVEIYALCLLFTRASNQWFNVAKAA